MYESARRYLQPYAPTHGGIDLESFLAEFRDCFEMLLTSNSEYPVGATLDPQRIPLLRVITDLTCTEVRS